MSSQIELLKKYRLPIQGQIGQHFLIDPNTQKKIVDFLAPTPKEPLLEIGPGLGALTGELLKRGAEVWAVEKDPRFIPVLKQEYLQNKATHLHLFCSDILTYDLKPLRQRFHKNPGRIRVIGNLPYYITAPILVYLLENRTLFREAVVMIQKEVAKRLLATPGTKDYGRLTLLMHYAADLELGFHVPATCFTPKPDVASSVLRIKFHEKPALQDKSQEAWLFELIKLAFSQRRKTFMHLLVRDARVQLTRDEIEAQLSSLGYSVKVRGEELSPKDFMALARSIPPAKEDRP